MRASSYTPPAPLKRGEAPPAALESGDTTSAAMVRENLSPAALESGDTISAAMVREDLSLAALESGDAPLAALETDEALLKLLSKDDIFPHEEDISEQSSSDPVSSAIPAPTPLLRGAGGVSPLSRGVRGVSPLLRGAGGVSSRRTIIPYNPYLKKLARKLRNKSTRSEITLWKQLKGKFGGKYDFHRQKPLDNYIADFFCYELKLVIEIDGITHEWEETKKKDYRKECRLNELGLNVLRFKDEDVLYKLDGPLMSIIQYIEGFEKGDLSMFDHENTPLNSLSRAVRGESDLFSNPPPPPSNPPSPP